MGRRGPAPTPTGVRLRQGETRPSRVNRMEPLPRRGAPQMPRGMDREAQRVWRRVVREMCGSDVIVGADADVLRCYCEAVSRYAQAAELYAASSPLMRRDGELVKNPLHQEVRDNADAVRLLARELGLSPSARAGLHVQHQGDLVLDAGFVRIRRTKTSVRAVPVSDDAVEALREALRIAPRVGPDEPVFFMPRLARRQRVRDRLRVDVVTHALPYLLGKKGLPRLTPHKLRHGAATLMLADGTPMRIIAEQLGHRNPALTARVYAHVVPEAQRAAVRALEPRRVAR